MTDELRLIIESHALWLKDGSGIRADLSRANLSGANLSGADLSGAILSRADLSRADLSWADLSRANLSGANLSGADLSGADLSWANLSRANLSGANLSRANLSRANLYGSDLSGANLSRAKNADLILAQTEIQSREGEVIGWKMCLDRVLVKIRVPSEAKRSNALGRKCRAQFVDVIEIIGAEVGVSLYDKKTEYKVGIRVTANGWTEDRLIECGQGIHYYLTVEEAKAHT